MIGMTKTIINTLLSITRPKKGTKKVIRGGATATSNMDALTFNRFYAPLKTRVNTFRCILNSQK